jgi:hypothetical protein
VPEQSYVEGYFVGYPAPFSRSVRRFFMGRGSNTRQYARKSSIGATEGDTADADREERPIYDILSIVCRK